MSKKNNFFVPSLILRIGAAIVGWRCALHDLVWFWPRQPLTGGLLAIILPRVITLFFPDWIYDIFALHFDGDSTPSMLLLVLLITALSGGLSSRVVLRSWLNQAAVVVLLLSPIAWLVRVFHAEFTLSSQDIAFLVDSKLGMGEVPPVDEKDFSFPSVDTAHWLAHLLNFHGNLPVLIPQRTFVYKEVDKSAVDDCGESLFPGDSAFRESRMRLVLNGQLELDVYEPFNLAKLRAQGIKPGVVLHLHGGGWLKGHRQFLRMNYHGGVPHAILENNFIVSASYRLSCFGIDGTKMLEDVVDAARFVKEHADEWGADSSKIVPWGTSAGGTLALLLAYKHHSELPIKGVINFYGVPELRREKLGEVSGSFYEDIHIHFFAEATEHLCETADSLHDTDEKMNECFEKISAIAHVTPESPPTFTLHGDQDGLVISAFADKLAETLEDNNVTHVTLKPQGVHDCDVFSSSHCSQAGIYGVRHFLKHVFAD